MMLDILAGRRAAMEGADSRGAVSAMKMGMRGLYLPRFDADAWFDAV